MKKEEDASAAIPRKRGLCSVKPRGSVKAKPSLSQVHEPSPVDTRRPHLEGASEASV